jgi:hypothetical protein
MYMLFMANLIVSTLRAAGRYCKEASLRLYFSPFLAGLIISWAYTYHLRKREFWIAFMLLVLCSIVSEVKRRELMTQAGWRRAGKPDPRVTASSAVLGAPAR